MSINKNDTIIHITIPKWRDQIQLQPPSGQVTGTVRYHKNIQGFNLKPRDLIVWYLDEAGRHSESSWAKRSWRFLELFFSMN